MKIFLRSITIIKVFLCSRIVNCRSFIKAQNRDMLGQRHFSADDMLAARCYSQ
jgi:hypothetical protein